MLSKCHWLASGCGRRRPRLQAVITTAAMDEAQRSAWCRENGVYPSELQQWNENATSALSEVPEERATPHHTRKSRKRIKELEGSAS